VSLDVVSLCSPKHLFAMGFWELREAALILISFCILHKMNVNLKQQLQVWNDK
jgi:hypothetical protein